MRPGFRSETITKRDLPRLPFGSDNSSALATPKTTALVEDSRPSLKAS